jgi:uncharacterized protein YukE
MGDIVASADGYRAVAKEFDQPIDTVKDAAVRLRNGLVAAGRPWSDKGMSKEFGEKFPPSMEELIKALGEISEGLTAIQGNFRTVAQNIENVEETNLK